MNPKTNKRRQMHSAKRKLSILPYVIASYGIFFGGNLTALVLSNLSYPWLRTSADQAYIVAVYMSVPAWTVMFDFLVPTLFISLYMWPVLIAIKRRKVTKKSQEIILNSPFTVSLIAASGWFLSFVGYIWAIFHYEFPFKMRPTVVFFTDVVITGSLCFVLCYYAFEYYNRRFILSYFFPDNVLSSCKAKRNLDIRSRFVIYYFAAGLFPIFVFLRVINSLTAQLDTDPSAMPLSIIAGILIVVGLGLSFLIGKSYETPLIKMKEKVERIMNSDFSTPVPVTSKDEIGMLGEGLNKMADELDEKQSIVKSIQYAKMIQSSILPDWEDLKDHFMDSFVVWKPREIVSGDFVYFRIMEDTMLIGVMDCTGHGVPGAFMTMLVSSGIRHIIDDEEITKPDEILYQLNRYVRTSLHQDRGESISDDGLDAAFCLINPKEKTLEYAGAKLPLTYLEDGFIKYIKGDRQSLGYRRSDPDFRFTSHTIGLEKSMQFYLYSDGYIDQLGEQKRICFGRKAFQILLEENGSKSMEEQKEIILESYHNHKGSALTQDDITIVGFAPNV